MPCRIMMNWTDAQSQRYDRSRVMTTRSARRPNALAAPAAPVASSGRPGIPRRRILGAAAGLAVAGSMAEIAAQEGGPTAVADAAALRAQRLAWAGIRLELPSGALFIDPLISADVWGPALKDEIVSVKGGPNSRHVLVTHLHNDHFDVAAVRKILPSNGTVFCQSNVASTVASHRFRVHGVDIFQPIIVGDYTITAVPAVDGYGDPQVSWVVAGGGRRVIHCGDTLWHGSWWQIGKQLGPFDAAFLPINGARFGWRKPVADVSSVMTPEQAVAAAVVLGAKRVVPIHYGVVGADSYEEQPGAEAALLAIARKRGVAVEVLRPGE